MLPWAPVLTDAFVGATNVWPKIVCVGTVPFAHRAATIGMTGGESEIAGVLIPAPVE